MSFDPDKLLTELAKCDDIERIDWYHRDGHDPLGRYRCLLCDIAFWSHPNTHLAAEHYEQAQRLYEEKLQPLTPGMNRRFTGLFGRFNAWQELRSYGGDMIAKRPCLPYPLAVVLKSPMTDAQIRWTFRRVEFDLDFANALHSAAVVSRNALVMMITQHHGSFVEGWP